MRQQNSNGESSIPNHHSSSFVLLSSAIHTSIPHHFLLLANHSSIKREIQLFPPITLFSREISLPLDVIEASIQGGIDHTLLQFIIPPSQSPLQYVLMRDGDTQPISN
ncbi:hypothetical protein RND81_04G017400 [Saponaria officinalis]|uniref:Uncharacterized protein n=1 Tax=Saponaria officinalis TaxID=3572 RepID=A0AAW1LFL3_SAPOF